MLISYDLSSLVIEGVWVGSEDRMSPLRAFTGTLRPKVVVINEHDSPFAQTGCRWAGRGNGGRGGGVAKHMKTRKRSLVDRAMAFGYYKDVVDHLFWKVYSTLIYIEALGECGRTLS